MKKLLLVVAFLFATLTAYNSEAQQVYSAVTRNIIVSSQVCSGSTRCNIIGSGAAFHQLTWNVSGTLSACSVQVDSSADGTTWNSGDIIAAQTCTSNGTITSTSHIVNYVRVNIVTITPVSSANLTVNLTGFLNLPSGGGNLSGTLTTPRVPFASAAHTLTDDANFLWDNTNKLVSIGGASSTTSAALTIIGAASGSASNPIETHTQAASTGITHYLHLTSGAQAPFIFLAKSRGTQASPVTLNSGDNTGYLDFGGYDGTIYTAPVLITSQTTNAWTATIHGATLDFNVTLPGANTSINAFRIGNTSSITISALDYGVISGKVIGIGNSASVNATLDTGMSRTAADVIGFGNGTNGDTTARLKAAAYMSVGTKFTQDTGCGTIVTSSGGATAGKFTTVGSTSCTTVITMGNSATAPNGWDCHALDLTTLADVTNPHQTASSPTTATIVTGTIVANDVIQFSCIGY